MAMSRQISLTSVRTQRAWAAIFLSILNSATSTPLILA
jgi:hypothetical protein